MLSHFNSQESSFILKLLTQAEPEQKNCRSLLKIKEYMCIAMNDFQNVWHVLEKN